MCDASELTGPDFLWGKWVVGQTTLQILLNDGGNACLPLASHCAGPGNAKRNPRFFKDLLYKCHSVVHAVTQASPRGLSSSAC